MHPPGPFPTDIRNIKTLNFEIFVNHRYPFAVNVVWNRRKLTGCDFVAKFMVAKLLCNKGLVGGVRPHM